MPKVKRRLDLQAIRGNVDDIAADIVFDHLPDCPAGDFDGAYQVGVNNEFDILILIGLKFERADGADEGLPVSIRSSKSHRSSLTWRSKIIVFPGGIYRHGTDKSIIFGVIADRHGRHNENLMGINGTGHVQLGAANHSTVFATRHNVKELIRIPKSAGIAANRPEVLNYLNPKDLQPVINGYSWHIKFYCLIKIGYYIGEIVR